MPLFSILFFILSLGNCKVLLTLNFVGEFMSLYGVFERLPLLGVFASSSIVFSAAYTIYMFNRIAFGGSFSKFFEANISVAKEGHFPGIKYPIIPGHEVVGIVDKTGIHDN